MAGAGSGASSGGRWSRRRGSRRRPSSFGCSSEKAGLRIRQEGRVCLPLRLHWGPVGWGPSSPRWLARDCRAREAASLAPGLPRPRLEQRLWICPQEAICVHSQQPKSVAGSSNKEQPIWGDKQRDSRWFYLYPQQKTYPAPGEEEEQPGPSSSSTYPLLSWEEEDALRALLSQLLEEAPAGMAPAQGASCRRSPAWEWGRWYRRNWKGHTVLDYF